MKNRTQLIGMLVVGTFALGQAEQIHAADANPPERMTYQGYLVDSAVPPVPLGNSAPTNYDIVFRVYAAKSGSQDAIWAEQQTVTVDKGYFSILLGEGSAYLSEPHGSLSSMMRGADISDRYIGLTVDTGSGATEIAPRLRLVSSPFAFTASQAMKLTDNAGNSNFFKDGTSLKLGAGSTPTLTLPEAGSATLVGKLTADLPGLGTGLQIDNGSLTTTIGAANASYFHFTTGLPKFYFNTDVDVDGKIRSHGQDTILGPSNNTDTYLKISKGSDDKISAYSNAFRVEDEANSSYLEINPNSSGVQFSTGSGTFQMTKPLEVTGSLSATGNLTSGGNITITKPDNEEAVLSLLGSSQGTGRLYVGQSTSHGGGIIYNGDASPAFAGSTEDAISFYRTNSGAHHEVFKYMYNSDNVTFNGTVSAKAYDMTVLSYVHPQSTSIGAPPSGGLKVQENAWSKSQLDSSGTTMGTMDKQFKVNNPDGAICEFNFLWSGYLGDGYLITHLIVTTDANGANNQAKSVKKAITSGDYPNITLNHSMKLSQGTHRVLVKYRSNRSSFTSNTSDYNELKLQVKVNGDADAVSSGWVTEKL